MDFNNLIDKEDYDRAMELDFMHTFDTEFKFFKILNNEERKLFQYANHMNEEKLNEAIQSFDVLNSNTFNTRDEARALSEYANTLTENTQKELTGKLLLFYIEDRTWDPSLRSVKNILEDVLILFESSLFHKIERNEENKVIEGKEKEVIIPNVSFDVNSTNITDTIEEEKKPTNSTITEEVNNPTNRNTKRMYPNGSAYLSSSNFDTEDISVHKVEDSSNNPTYSKKTVRIVVLSIILFVLLIFGITFSVSYMNRNSAFPIFFKQNEKEKIDLYYSTSRPSDNILRVYVSCSSTYYDNNVKEVYGELVYVSENDQSNIYCTITPKRNCIDIYLTSTTKNQSYKLIFNFECIIYENGEKETYREVATLV